VSVQLASVVGPWRRYSSRASRPWDSKIWRSEVSAGERGRRAARRVKRTLVGVCNREDVCWKMFGGA